MERGINLVNKGAVAEMFAGLEFIKNGNTRIRGNLFYWENLSRGASAEVDYVAAYNMEVLPIEVKSGVSGKMKSLRLFMESKRLHTAIRTSLENFGKIEIRNSEESNASKLTINIIPLYAVYNYRNYLRLYARWGSGWLSRRLGRKQLRDGGGTHTSSKKLGEAGTAEARTPPFHGYAVEF